MSEFDALPEADRNFILANLELAGVDITDPREAPVKWDALGRFDHTENEPLKRLRLSGRLRQGGRRMSNDDLPMRYLGGRNDFEGHFENLYQTLCPNPQHPHGSWHHMTAEPMSHHYLQRFRRVLNRWRWGCPCDKHEDRRF